MPDYEVRIAHKDEINSVVALLIKERSRYPSFARLLKSPLRRFMYERWVTPRYLRSSANTFVLRQEGQLAGYAVVEQSGAAVHLADFMVSEGFDVDPLLSLLLPQVEQLALDRDYHFVRATPWETDEQTMATFTKAGFHLLDYYLWAFSGTPQDTDAPENVILRELGNREHGAYRTRFLTMELDASGNEGRDLIDAVFLKRRLPPFKAYAIELEDENDATTDIGYLSPRPDERGDGVLSLVISLDPTWWASDLEMQIIGGFLSEVGKGKPQPARVLVSTGLHADRIEPAMATLGLTREMDLRPVLYKTIARATPPEAAQTTP